jgi:hypothetical protein
MRKKLTKWHSILSIKPLPLSLTALIIGTTPLTGEKGRRT